jgi:hypothetical protein
MPVGNEGRSEKRTAIQVPLELVGLDSPGVAERAMTENVSPLGARVITGRSWPFQQNVLIVTSSGSAQVRARIVYCVPLGTGRFAVGLRFVNSPIGRVLNLKDRST